MQFYGCLNCFCILLGCQDAILSLEQNVMKQDRTGLLYILAAESYSSVIGSFNLTKSTDILQLDSISFCVTNRSSSILHYIMDKSKKSEKVHQILLKNGYYQLPMHNIKEVLLLLEQPNTIIPMQIQFYTINGLLQLSTKYKKDVSLYFRGAKFRSIPEKTKIYINKIVQEIQKIQLSLEAQQKQMQLENSNHQLQYPFNKPNLNENPKLYQKGNQRATAVQPFHITLIKEAKDEPMQQMVVQYARKRGQEEIQQQKNQASDLVAVKTVDAFVQTDLVLLDEEFETYELGKKAHLFNEKIDFIQQAQVRKDIQPKDKNEDLLKKQQIHLKIINKKNTQTVKKTAEQIKNQQKYIIKFSESKLMPIENETMQQPQILEQPLLEKQFQKCICKGAKKEQPFYKCYFCKSLYHNSCHHKESTISQYQQCPLCTLRELDPNYQIEEILSQNFFVTNTTGSLLFKAEYNFKPYQYYCSQKMRTHQIQVRCLRVSQNQQYVTESSWPSKSSVFLNGHKIFEVLPIDKDPIAKKRRGLSLKIAEHLYFDEKQAENIQKTTLELISQSNRQLSPEANSKVLYLIGVYYTSNITFQDLCTKFQGRILNSKKSYMQSLITNCNLEDIQIGKISYSLLDPYAWNIIKQPVRGVYCRHAQCFDLETYLSFMYGNRNKSWKCPVCNKAALILVKDLLQLTIIQKIKNCEGLPKQITYFNNGEIEIKMFRINQESQQEEVKNNFKQSKIKKRKLKQAAKNVNTKPIQEQQVNNEIRMPEVNQFYTKKQNEESRR